jgi:hypothetical protein
LRQGRVDLADWLGNSEEGGLRDVRGLVQLDFARTVDRLIAEQAALVDDADLVEPDEPRMRGRRR